jgi:hypothetical protein
VKEINSDDIEKIKSWIDKSSFLLINIIFSVLVFHLIKNVNSFTFNILETIFISPIAILVFLSVIFAPIIEEFGKRFFLKRNCIMLFTLIFAFLELIFYIRDGSLFSDRISVVFVHLTLAFVQKTYHEKSINENNIWISRFGFLGAILIHSFYNLSVIAILNN